MLLPDEYHSYFKIYIDNLSINGKSIIENLIDTFLSSQILHPFYYLVYM